MLSLSRAWPAYFVLLLALAATAVGTRYVAQTVRSQDRDRFENAVQSTADDLRSRIETYTDVLLGGAGLFAATKELVSRSTFQAYVRRLDLPSRYPGIQGVGYTFRIPPGTEKMVIDWMRDQGFSDFRLWPEGEREEKHAILHLEPLDRRNAAAIGYDMFSDPVRREAMSRARDTGGAAASGRVTLVQEIYQVKQAGFLIYVPVYAHGRPASTVEERRDALIGFVYSPFRGDDLLAGIFGSQVRPRVHFEIYDGPEVDRARLLGRSHIDVDIDEKKPLFETALPMEVAGRQWTLRLATTEAFAKASHRGLAVFVAVAGVILSLVLFAVVWLQIRARQSAERLAADLRESETALRLANQGKDDFLAMLGHELRNPLGAMSNAVALIRRSRPGEPAFERAIDVVERQVNLQRRLLSDLLDVSRVSSGRIEIERRVLDLDELVRETVQAHEVAVEQAGLRIEMEPAGTPLAVEGDPARLDQIFSNLLSNAIKYTPPPGRIEVRVERQGEEAVVSVRDDGLGMSPELQARVFEPFVQDKRSLDRSQGGLGLGLTLVRRLVELHGGRVSVESGGPRRGSEFVVRLPLADPSRLVEPAPAPSEERSDVSGRHVLVIEDMEDARASLAELLGGWGCRVTVAADGREGLRLAMDESPDVALVDIGLPGVDGYEVARRLRGAPNGKKMVLIALTGYGQADDRRAALDAGFDFHLVKPLDMGELQRMLGNA